MNKKCTMCGELKPASVEYFNKKRKSLNSRCRKCTTKYSRERYWNKTENKSRMGRPWLLESSSGAEDLPLPVEERYSLFPKFKARIFWDRD